MIEFVSQDEDMQGATFRDDDGEFHLNNVQIQQRGLVDVMRTALASTPEHVAAAAGFEAWRQRQAEVVEQEDGRPTNGAGDQRPPAESPKPLGGYTDEWRWQVVQDDKPCPTCEGPGKAIDPESVGVPSPCRTCRGRGLVPGSTLMAIDNQPAIRAHGDPTSPAPQLQKIVIPLDILRLAAGA